MSRWFIHRCIDLLFTRSEVSQWHCVGVCLLIPCVSTCFRWLMHLESRTHASTHANTQISVFSSVPPDKDNHQNYWEPTEPLRNWPILLWSLSFCRHLSLLWHTYGGWNRAQKLCATCNGSHKSQKNFFIDPPPPQPSGVILLTYNTSAGNSREQENLQPF